MRRKPVVGVIGNATRIENQFPVQVVGERNCARSRMLRARCR